MSLKPKPSLPVPEETAFAARKAFPKGNVFMKMRDELGVIFEDEQFATLFASDGQPAESPSNLALVVLMQFVENLTDRQAAEAVRDRLTWKYALGLELTDTGFDSSVLCEFRERLVNGGQERLLFDRLLERLKAKKLLRAGGKQRSDSTHVLAAVRELNQVELVGETLRSTLNHLAQVVPDWLRKTVPDEWFDRYAIPFELSRLSEKKKERQELAEMIGEDGFFLLMRMNEEDAPSWLYELPAVKTLRLVWMQQYYGPHEGGKLRAKGDKPPCSQTIETPYDTEVHYASKGSRQWKGYRVHLTESCDDDLPHLISDVQTVLSTTNDQDVTPIIHQSLEERELLPAEHIVDTGYTGANNLLLAQAVGIEIVGKVLLDPSWQRREETGYDSAAFGIDWETQAARCPKGKPNWSWREDQTKHGTPIIQIGFAKADCSPCEARPLCTRSKLEKRTITILDQARYDLIKVAREYQLSEEFKGRYAKRAGVEGCISQAVNAFGLRKTRYRGLAKTRLQHLATAAAINIVRLSDWLMDTPRSKTRISHFARLKPDAA